jgi:DNA repair exonuclease SbcCD ATPase subunit
MTRTRYFIARVAQAFGFNRRNVRMSEAATEMHLLREAEAVLGATIWKNVEPIESLSVEYWNLRKLIKEREEVRQKIKECMEKVEASHRERAEMLSMAPEGSEELLQKRVELLARLEQNARERDTLVAEAREVRRAHVGLKMKLEVLLQETTGTSEQSDEVEKVKRQLTDLRDRFAHLKEERIRIGHLIEQGDNQIDEVDAKIQEHRQARRAQASDSFQVIGDINKQLSSYRAESALLDTRMRQLHAEIGRYISRHALHQTDCAKAAAEQRGLVDVMRALRRSIALNHRLAGTS